MSRELGPVIAKDSFLATRKQIFAPFPIASCSLPAVFGYVPEAFAVFSAVST